MFTDYNVGIFRCYEQNRSYMNNPFIFENFATGSSFCGRKAEIKSMEQLCSDGNNILLYSKRRFGKSSLIKQLFCHHLPKKRFLTIYVDLFEILDANDFAKLFYKASAVAMKFSIKTASQNLIKYFRKVHFSVSLDESGAPSFTPTLASRDFDELLDDTFKGLVRYASNKNMNVVVAFDEFQQVTEITDKKIDAIIRKYIQNHTKISYIFSGSKQHILTGLFTGQRKPLYSMATGIELKSIDTDDFFMFANKLLNGRLMRDSFVYLNELVAGESKLLQQACYNFYYLDGEIDNAMVDEVVDKIIKQSDGEYRMIFENITKTQKTALKAVALHNGIGLFYKDVLSELGITKQALLGSLKALIKTDMVYKENDQYFITDRKLYLWCKSLYSE